MNEPDQRYEEKQQARQLADNPAYQQAQEIEQRRKAADRQQLADSLVEINRQNDPPPPATLGEPKPKAPPPQAPNLPPTHVGIGEVGSSLWHTWDESMMRWLAGLNQQRLEHEQEILGKAGIKDPGTDKAVADTSNMIDSLTQSIAAQTPNFKGHPGMEWLYHAGTALRDMVPSILATAVTKNPWAFAPVMAPQLMGNEYVRRRMAGEDPSAARLGAMFFTGVEVLTERGPMGAALKAGKSFLSKTLSTMFAEGSQEGLTGVVEDIYDKATIDPKKSLGEILWDGIYQGSIGAVIGGGMSAAASGVDKVFVRKLADQHGLPEADVEEIVSTAPKGLNDKGLSDFVDSEVKNSDVRLTPSTAQAQGLVPKVRLPKGSTRAIYAITRNGKEVGFTDITISPDGVARIEDIVADRTDGSGDGPVRGRNELGARAMRSLLQQFMADHPEVTKITGERVSGIRRKGRHGLLGTGVEVQVNVDRLRSRLGTTDKTPTEQMAQTARIQKVPPVNERLADDFYRGIDAETKAKYKDRAWQSVDLRRFETSDDVLDVIRQTAGQNADPKQTIPWETTKERAAKLAREGGLSEDAVIGWTREKGLNTDQLEAAGMVMLDSAQKVRDAQQILKTKKDSGTLTNRDRLGFRELLARHAAILQSYSGMSEEAGRTLNILRSVSGRTGAYEGQINDLLSQYGGEKVTDDLIDAIDSLDNVAAMNKFVKNAYKVRGSDMIHELWLNGLLSGLRTHEVNFMGSGLATTWLNAEQLVSGAIGDIKSGAARLFRQNANPDSASVREAVPYLYGEMMGLVDGVRLFGKALKTGQSAMDPMTKFEGVGKTETPARGTDAAATVDNLAQLAGKKPPSGTAAKALDYFFSFSPVAGRLPTRLLVAEDDFWKAINYRANLHSLAYRQAKKAAFDAGKEGDSKFIAETASKLTEEVSPELHQQALAKAREATFTGDPQGKIWSGLERAAKGLRHIPVVGRYMVPFARTPINIMKFVYQRTPLAVTDPEVLSDLRAGGARQETAIAKIALGSSLMALGGLMASSGLLMGGGPPDNKRGLNEAMHRLGWKPRSLRIPAGYFGPNDPPRDQFHDISRTDPMGLFMTLVGDTYDVMKWSDDQDTNDEIAANVAIAVSDSFANETYLKGVSDFFDAWVSDPKRYMKYWVRQMAGSFVPNIIHDVDRHFADRTRRQVNSVLDAFRNRIPGLSKDLPPQRDLWGAEITDQDFNMFMPIQSSEMASTPATPLDVEIVKNGWNIQRPSPVWNGFDLRNYEATIDGGQRRNAYERLLELRGQVVTDPQGRTMVQALNDLIDSNQYQTMGTPGPDGTRYLAFRQVMEVYDSMARQQLVKDFPELGDKVDAAQKALRDAKVPHF